jgi:hypothetical protein
MGKDHITAAFEKRIQELKTPPRRDIRFATSPEQQLVSMKQPAAEDIGQIKAGRWQIFGSVESGCNGKTNCQLRGHDEL